MRLIRSKNECAATIEEIEAAIAELTPEEFEKLGEWIDQRRETAFDAAMIAHVR